MEMEMHVSSFFHYLFFSKSLIPTQHNIPCVRYAFISFLTLSHIMYHSFRLQYLVFTKGELMLALVLNPLLFAMRGPRNALACLKSWILQKVASTKRAKVEHMPREEDHTRISAKERVVRKWGRD